MKKQYNQPVVNAVEIMPQLAILSGSGTGEKDINIQVSEGVINQW